MANRKIDLGVAQTKGVFVVTGKVTGRYSNNFYSEGTSQSGVPWRRVHFGVEIESGKVVYIDMFGAVTENVYFSKSIRGADGKNQTTTKSVSWASRTKTSKQLFGEDGYRIIGINCGCKKTIDKNGKEVNDNKNLTSYDACDEVGNLNDGDSVYVRGNITYSTYEGKHRVSFEPTQISLARDEIDFDAVDFQPHAVFNQNIVFKGVTKNEEVPGEYIINALIVNYQSIEEAEFYTRELSLAKNLKKLGEYCYVECWGEIVVEGSLEEVKEEDNGWGRANPMKRVASPFTRKLIVIGANPDTLDKDSYSKDKIEHALEIIAGIQSAKKDYGKMSDDIDDGDSNGWGRKQAKQDNTSIDDMDLDELV